MKESSIERKIYYHDTDAGGVVYYGNYLKHLEEGRNEFCAEKGIDLREWISKGIEFPVVHAQLDYKSPAKYGDIIRISTKIEKIGNSSIHFAQEIKRDDVVLVKARTVWACIGEDFKSKSMPEEIKKLLLA
jgi:acyl-CoA thioester hydrolase